MENTSLLSVAWENVTTSLLESADVSNYLTNIRDHVLKVIYIIIGIVGVLDNLFVIVIFLLFIKITDKVFGLRFISGKHLKTCSIWPTVYNRINVSSLLYIFEILFTAYSVDFTNKRG